MRFPEWFVDLTERALLVFGLIVLLMVIVWRATAHAAWLPSTTVTAPRFEASSTGDTCAASVIPQQDNMVYRRTVVAMPPLVASFTDSLVNVAPGTVTTSPRLNNIPRGTYLITVTWRDPAANISCPETITRTARGGPSRSGDLGLILADEQRNRFLIMAERTQ